MASCLFEAITLGLASRALVGGSAVPTASAARSLSEALPEGGGKPTEINAEIRTMYFASWHPVFIGNNGEFVACFHIGMKVYKTLYFTHVFLWFFLF